MSSPTLEERVRAFLSERQLLGFQASQSATFLIGFARAMDSESTSTPLTAARMAAWARRGVKPGGTRATWARRLKRVRPFVRWLQQFDPRTEVPEEPIFGPVPGRVTPHIYREGELVELLAAAHQLGPIGGLRPATFQTLFGLIASTGLRLGEALALRDRDVDLTAGTLTVRQSKFAKSRALPLHPSVVTALAKYRRIRAQFVRGAPQMRFFVGSRGRRLGQPIDSRTAHRVFAELRRVLGWPNRGAHHAPRVHDMRHSFAVRRVMLWYAQGIDVDQAMLSLSTYLGHAKISNTYWYLTAVPELMRLAAGKFERFAEAAGAGRA
jgi:integrase